MRWKEKKEKKRRTRIQRVKGHANFTSEHHPRSSYREYFFLQGGQTKMREGAAPLKDGRDSQPSHHAGFPTASRRAAHKSLWVALPLLQVTQQ